MATAGLADMHNNSCWGRTVMRKDSWDHTDVQRLSPAELQRGDGLPPLSSRTLLPPLWPEFVGVFNWLSFRFPPIFPVFSGRSIISIIGSIIDLVMQAGFSK